MSTPRKRRGDCTIYDLDPEMGKLKERDDRFTTQELELLAFTMREDSLWDSMNAEQRGKVYEWLFEENLTYAQAAERIMSGFGLTTSVSSVGRMFRCLARTWQRAELLYAQNYADLANSMPGKTGDMRAATIKLLAAQAVRRATEKPGSLEDLLALAKMLLNSEENEIRLRRVRLEEEQFGFHSAMARGGEMEKVRAYLEEIESDKRRNAGEKQEQVDRVKAFLFGNEQTG